MAPRGEFSKGALVIKEFKKKVFLYFCSFIGLHKNVTFQSSSEFEENDIIETLGENHFLKILIAPNLSPIHDLNENECLGRTSPGKSLRIVFLSRISSKKKLDYALLVLSEVKASVRI